jgi:putative molybdopterin biosynthesis protein
MSQSKMINSPVPTSQDAGQEQFLTVLSRDEALARFEAALFPRALPAEERMLADALSLTLAKDVTAPIDVPPFDRSNVDGFAVRAADLATASEALPARLLLNRETIACGVASQLPVLEGTATSISTGGPVPRGADAIVMVEHTQPTEGDAIEVRRGASPGQFVSHAGSDIARGEILLRAGTMIGSREIGMLAACGIALVTVARKLRVAVLSTGDELVQPGQPLGPAGIYDANGAIVSAAVTENGGEATFLGAVPDDEATLEAAMREALATHDMLILSGGTSKGAGDVSHRIVNRLGKPGIVAHGVALKPGKPLCLAVCDGKPVVILPGFPTSAMFTFHDMIVPVLRRMAGLPPRTEAQVAASIPFRIPSELGRTEFVMVSLVEGEKGLVAYPTGKGSGAITSFAQADGFIRIEALADHLPAGSETPVMKFASSEARNSAALATSQPVPILARSGTLASRMAAISARLLPVTRARVSTAIGVSMSPGRMVLARTPCSAFWIASCCVYAIMAALVALYATVGYASQAATEEMVMITPERCARMIGSACLQAMTQPRRLMAEMRSKASSVISVGGASPPA